MALFEEVCFEVSNPQARTSVALPAAFRSKYKTSATVLSHHDNELNLRYCNQAPTKYSFIRIAVAMGSLYIDEH